MKTTSLVRFASLVTLASASLLAACGDNLPDGSGVGGNPVTNPTGGAVGSGGMGGTGSNAGSGTGSSNPAAIPYPASCDDVAQGRPLPDGDQVLYHDNDPAFMWTAYCHDGAEYLTLPSTDPDANFGIYQAGGDALGTSVKTQYQRVRIDPATLAIDINDMTFATSTGDITHAGDPDATAMPFGVAMACGGGAVFASAVVDLTGTPFALSRVNFANGGVSAGGDAQTQSWQKVLLTANGSCGWESPFEVVGSAPINPKGQAYALSLSFN